MVAVNHGIIKFEIEKRQFVSALGRAGWTRNTVALWVGSSSAPLLALLAVFDAKRFPRLHIACIVLFFVLSMAYVSLNNSSYEILVQHSEATSSLALKAPRIKLSLKLKQITGTAFYIFTLIYSTSGLFLVSDLFDYQREPFSHSIRSFFQLASLFSLNLYYLAFYYDFEGLSLTIIQRGTPFATSS